MKRPLKTLVKSKILASDIPEPTPEYEPGPMERRNILRQVAADARRLLPPAVVKKERRVVLVNFKISEGLAISLAKRSRETGVTQKQIITRLLASAGFPADAQDLEDGSKPRRGDSIT